jgi:hypothetical protein
MILTELNEEQVDRMQRVRERWLKIGLQTGPCDRKKCERLIDPVYQSAGLEPPKIKIWLSSPIAGWIGSVLLGKVEDKARDQVMAQVKDQVWAQVGAQVEDQVRDKVRDKVGDKVMAQVLGQVWDQVGDQVWGQVWDQVGDQVGDQVMAQVKDQVWDQVGGQVWDQVWAQVKSQVRDQVRAKVWDQVREQVWGQVWDQVKAQVKDQVKDQVLDQVHRCGYGIHDSSWLSFYDYFYKYLQDECQLLRPMIEFSKEVGWWWPLDNAVIFTERPIFLTRDDNFRLHHESRRALEYADGFGIWAWHGVRVPQWVIESPEKITPQKVLTENNQEIRRVMLERYGWDRLLIDLQATTEQTDRYGTLVSTDRLGEYLDGEDPIAKFVFVSDPSTNRRYALRVPPECTTAHQAVAWTGWQEEKDYEPIQEA